MAVRLSPKFQRLASEILSPEIYNELIATLNFLHECSVHVVGTIAAKGWGNKHPDCSARTDPLSLQLTLEQERIFRLVVRAIDLHYVPLGKESRTYVDYHFEPDGVVEVIAKVEKITRQEMLYLNETREG